MVDRMSKQLFKTEQGILIALIKHFKIQPKVL